MKDLRSIMGAVVALSLVPITASTSIADTRDGLTAANGGPTLIAQVGQMVLTADEAVAIGLQHNPQIAAARAAVRSAAAAAGALKAFPSVQLGVTHSEGTSTAPSLNGLSRDTFIDLGESIDISGQRRFQAAGLGAQRDVAQFTLHESSLTLTQQIRDAYWTLVSARAQTTIANESLTEVRQVYDLTRTQEQAGSAPHQDVVRSSIDVANSTQASVVAQGTEKTALAALNLLLGRPPFAPVVPADTMAEDSPPPLLNTKMPPLEQLERTAEMNRPLLKAAQAQVKVTDYALKQVKAGRFPDLSVDYERSLQLPSSSDTVLLGARFPLLDLGEVRGNIRAAAEIKNQSQALALQTSQTVAQQVAQALTDITQAKALATSYRTDILAPSKTLLDMAQTGYKQGATGILPVIDAETTLRNARTGYISALLSLYKASDELAAATGAEAGPVPKVTQ